MNLTKQTEVEVLKVYEHWLHIYLNGDVATYDSYLADDFHFIGSTSNAEFLDRKDTTRFFEKAAHQLSGKTELRNETKIVEQFDELVFITHVFDAWFLNGKEWTFYSRFRFSNVLQKKKEGWKFIYQHYSTPDAKAQEGETMGFDHITKENVALREAIQRRTKELEEKNKVLEIEAALNTIRNEAVEMKSSTDLLDIVVTLRNEFIKLGHEAHYFWHMMWLEKTYEKAMTSGDGSKIGFVMELPRHMHGDIPQLSAWEQSEDALVVYPMEVDEAIDYVDKMVALGNFKQIDPQAPTHDDIRAIGGLTFIMARTTHGEIGYSLPGVVPTPPQESLDVLERFAGVFDLAHQRFLDLQTAENQTRETQIELALEKVRSRTMAMQRSEELKEVIQTVYDQFVQLQMTVEHTGFIMDYKEHDEMHLWLADHNEIPSKIILPYFDSPHWNSFLKAKTAGETLFTNKLSFEEKNKFYKDMLAVLPEIPPSLFDRYFKSPGLAISTVLLEDIGLYIENFEGIPYTEAENEVLLRLGKVFQQTYTRFKDLQKAEQQAREAEIETALEKVRSRTMAMQHSDELSEAANNLFLQVQALGIPAWSAGYCIWEDSKQSSHCHMSSEGQLQKSFSLPTVGEGYDFLTPHQDGATFHVKELGGEALVKHYEFMHTLPTVGEILDALIEAGLELPTFQIFHICYFEYGYVMFITYEAVPEAHPIFKRFGKVFEQTYTRFLDLQKAEAQTREAKIEAALEKVRIVALSLDKSDDMLEIARVLYEQLLALGFDDIRNAIIDIHDDEEETFLDYDYSHDMSSAVTKFSFYGDPVIEQQIKQTQSSHDAFFEIELKGDDLKELIQTRIRNGEKDDPRLHEAEVLTYNLYSFGNGAIGISNFGVLTDEQKIILKRFRNVFTFAYQRYTDLAKAEAQAREAKIEASLEKVRSVALEMDESKDLLHIAKALYEQLVELGFSEIRNAIIDVNNEDDETFLDYDYSDEMGSTVTLMSYNDDPTLEEQVRIIANTTDGYSEMLLEGQQLQDLIEMRRKNGEADDPRLYKTDRLAYILYAFGNGAIGISNFGELSKDQKEILDRFRIVFTFAYQRFIDLQLKEKQGAELLAEKQRLEATLTDLQATQKQLIQSEKMASLGELTAGIAHEIQNPLNFVNNFSEISNELIDEMNEEIANGDMEEAKAISEDIKQNLEKINHHGKRADAIVKGMLQHSRKSTAIKEPTDINKLADEYVRLAYHGLRAKDKSFNATLTTHFDEALQPVPVIAQDIGRVILNLITNAFYATNEKKKRYRLDALEVVSDYKPTVVITTKKEKEHVLISVEDNGSGIPKDVIDKIFQPFFTTKPTGQGTGLGLSMSYDIVTKGHNGEFKVTTAEGEGTTFTILIPRSQ